MFTRYVTKKKLYALSALILFALLLMGCGEKTATSTTVSVNNSVPQNLLASPSVSSGTAATATLKHQPVGTATLNWSPTDRMLTIQLMLTGLAPSSIHPVRVGQGSCSSRTETATLTPKKALYSLENATADAHGVVNTSSKISLPTGIPAKNWFLEVYNGPGLATTSQATPIACGDVINHDISLKSAQSVQVVLQAPENVPGQNVQGDAQLSITGRTLTVKVTVSGLVPETQHVVHIHKGTCASQGDVVYPLKTLVADAAGKATATTTIPDVSAIPASGWYINVHNSNNLSTQAGFEPIACGDVVLNRA